MAEASTDGSGSGRVKPIAAGRRQLQHARRRLTGGQKASRILVTGDTLKDKQIKVKEEREAKLSHMDPRHDYIVKTLAENMQFDISEVEECMLDGDQVYVMDKYFEAEGPGCLMFFCEGGPRHVFVGTTVDGEVDNMTSAIKPSIPGQKSKLRVFLTDGSHEPFPGTCAFFLRLTSKPLTVHNIGNETYFGMLEANGGGMLGAIRHLLTTVFIPALHRYASWGLGDAKDSERLRREFLVKLESFVHILAGAEESLSDVVSLHPCEEVDLALISTPSDYLRASANPEIVEQLERCLVMWCKDLEQILTKSDQMRKEADNVGPRVELEYWKKRMAQFNSLLAHARSKECKAVVGVLHIAKSKLLKTWRELDSRITEGANEAKDNVKFLHTLEKYCDPLYQSDPVSMVESLPGLINAIRMIHSYSRYYNTAERMTALFVKVTNQMITACKDYITNHGFQRVWDQDMDTLVPKLESCMKLNTEYQQCVQRVKQKILDQTEERPLIFSEMYVFGKFNTFGRRLEKIIAVLALIKAYQILGESHIEGIEVAAARFQVIVNTLKKKPYDVLDHRKTDFDIDYQEFRSSISDFEVQLQVFFGQCFDKIQSTRRSLQLLARFEGLMLPCLDIAEKYQLILLHYLRDIDNTSRVYNQHKTDPPVEGTMPPVAGKIQWARQLLRRIEEPMAVFQEYPQILQIPSAKKVIRKYNQLARVLLEFEVLYHQAWLKQVDIATHGIHVTVLASNSKTKEVLVNFDESVLLVIREVEVMEKLGLDVPVSAIGLKSKQTVFKQELNQLRVMLSENARIRQKILPLFANSFSPHMDKVDAAIEPGLIHITWTSLTFSSFVDNTRKAISELELVIDKVNGIYKNVIEVYLEEVSCCILCKLPESEPLTTDEFLKQTQECCDKAAEFINSRSTLIEEAVYSLVDLLLGDNADNEDEEVESQVVDMDNDQRLSKRTSISALSVSGPRSSRHESGTSLDPSRPATRMLPPGALAAERRRQKRQAMRREADELIAYFEQCCQECLLKAIRSTLENLKKCASSATSHRYGEVEKKRDGQPVFRCDMVLAIPNIIIQPSLDDVQQTVNKAAQMVLGVAKHVYLWGQLEQQKKLDNVKIVQAETLSSRSRLISYSQGPLTDTSTYSRVSVRQDQMAMMAAGPPLRSHFKGISENKELTKLVSILSTAINSTKNAIVAELHKYESYNMLWKQDRVKAMEEFMQSHPQVAEFEAQILYYAELEREILEKPEVQSVGAILLVAEPLKIALCAEAKQWRVLVGDHCNNKYRLVMEQAFQFINDSMKRLARPIKDLDDVHMTMCVLQDIRESEIRIDSMIAPVEESYAMLNRYQLPLIQEETERVDTLRYSWSRLLSTASQVQDHLISLQSEFKERLVTSISTYQEDLSTFYSDYAIKGPMAPDVSPREASDRLIVYQNRFDTLWRQFNTCRGGEELFGLPLTNYPDLVRIRKELSLLQKLYGLYNNVNDGIDGYFEIPWNEVDIDKINAELLDFQNRCRKLPRGLKDWQAYLDLKKKIDDFNETCPLLESMAHKSMKPRHWSRITEITGHTFDIEAEGFVLRNIMEAPLLEHKEDIEDICIAAVKEQDIEGKLKAIESEWSAELLHFSSFKNRGELLLKGDETMETVSRMEDSLMVLSSLLSNRYNAPFKAKIQKWVQKLSSTTEIIESWLAVQNLWIYLEAVFVGGDIAKQLPKEAKRFQNIDKSWIKIMTRAHETPNVVQCCVGDEMLGQLLPHLLEQLELCQKSLSGYLEAKRLLFPRFFFVSDPALLEILGQASDSHTIQRHLLSIFDNVKTVTFHEKDYDRILAISSREEIHIDLEKPVMAHGNVEQWLMHLLNMMQRSVHGVIRHGAFALSDPSFDLMAFLDTLPAQVGLLGLQMLWTREAEKALSSARSDKKAMATTDQEFLDMLNLLIDKTTEDLSHVERTKYETLITIHVHQRDIFHDLVKMHIRSSSDFEWLKQCRFYYNSDVDKCVIAITDVSFTYQNEFLGCTERLVITPLTDRCYITLAQALGLSMGGSPAGPAGTGKTETVKDMGKALGKYVVVFNCSDQMDYRGLGRIFKGLAQSGSWGCFDEFNRIELPVLSVAAQQISVVLACKKERKKQFVFTDGDVVKMNPEFGLFLTMNPGYAGRQELPENLKMQFRGVAMMVPDRQIIIRVKLASCGFQENIGLARKFFTLYKLCEEQLSKQVHYDFGLRNILSVLRTLGDVKRKSVGESENDIVMRVMRDMNLSKLVDEDEPLFLSLISDLFPGVNMDKAGYPDLEEAIANQVNKAGLIHHPPWTLKLIQLFETQRVRHGMMVLGPAGAGKTQCIHILMRALTDIGMPHREMRMNPKAITASQMFGKLDVATNDWTDGIFSTLWRKTLRAKKGEHVWLVLDGPVDTLWIENLNSVLDDNKTLTLANGDRIPMATNCKIIFEPDNVDNASPATVSRNGMVYMSSSGLDWKPILQGWLKKRKSSESSVLTSLFNETFQEVFNYFCHNLNPKMKLLECNYIDQAIKLLKGLIPPCEDGSTISATHTGRLFSFALMWSLGALLELDDRSKLEAYLRRGGHVDLPDIPSECSDTMFEYLVNNEGLVEIY
jgi:dynein heavy chain